MLWVAEVRRTFSKHFHAAAQFVESHGGKDKMCGYFLKNASVSRRLSFLAVLLCACAPRMALSQTPSPLQEWQYPGGISLYKLFEPNPPEWHVVLGVAEVALPIYDGARPYHAETGPVIDIRYRDIAFASVGEGLGVNIVRGENYRAGIAIAYDLGRKASDYPSYLHGLGDIRAAPVIKLFGSYVISKEFPLVLRADVRKIVGGAEGLLGDLEAFLPLPGSSKTLVMLAGPSITFANRQYQQKVFGVSATQALASGFPGYDAHGSANAAGMGFSATRFITPHWLVTADVAVNRLLGSARDSPITQSAVQGVLALSTAYRW
jgi:outer membrane scaffolding protein for murein synthesis (MipA/OmpV family)